VCCDSDCSAACRACVQSSTGLANGTCGVVSAGTDPFDRCPGSDVCDSGGRCRCSNGQKDGSETCVDCGGPDCAACAPQLFKWSCGPEQNGGCCYPDVYTPYCSLTCQLARVPVRGTRRDEKCESQTSARHEPHVFEPQRHDDLSERRLHLHVQLNGTDARLPAR
jgi:hypothetical protein